jgi:hypothetical protein
VDVVGQRISLVQRELGRRRAGITGLGVRHGCAIAHGPQPGVTQYGQVLVHCYSASFVVLD